MKSICLDVLNQIFLDVRYSYFKVISIEIEKELFG